VSSGEILFSHNRTIPARKIPRVTSTAGASSPPAVIASNAGGNLLNTPNLEQGVKKGNWQVQNGRLLFKGNSGDGVISFPHSLPKQLHLTLKASPAGVGPSTCIALYFKASDVQFIVQLAQDGSCVIVDGKDPRGDHTAKYDPVFVDNRQNTVAYEIHDETLVVRVNGRRFLTFKDARLGKTNSNDFALGVVGEWTFQTVQIDPL
jgi:hypothetical protein